MRATALTLLWLSLGQLTSPSYATCCSDNFPRFMSDVNGYIDYWVGDMNLIISAPHGGDQRPSGMPERSAGCLVNGACVYSHTCGAPSSECRVTTSKDSYTLEIAQGLRHEIERLTGQRPHLIANMLHRSRLDANRELDIATFGVPEAVYAFNNYTHFVEIARSAVINSQLRVGLFLDIHGQTHEEEWVELGYRIDRDLLNDESYVRQDSSIRYLGQRRCGTDVTCFRGLISDSTLSFGGLLAGYGYRVVPSPADPSPGAGGYYRGGYNTERFGSKLYGSVDAIQIEMPRSVRFGDRQTFISALAATVVEYMRLHVYMA